MMGAECSVEKVMGLTPAQFRRTLANAVGPQAAISEAGDGLSYRINWPGIDDQCVAIELTPQPDRRIAAITLPVTRVVLRFAGMDEGATKAFLTRFDLYYHKGGG